MENGWTLLVTVLVILLGTVGIYYLSYYFVGSDVSTEYVQRSEIDATTNVKPILVPASKMDKLAGYSDYSFALWFYVSDFQTGLGSRKVFIQRGEDKHLNPVVYLAPYKNDLVVEMGYGGHDGTVSTVNCTIPDVPVQRWCHLAVNVLANGTNIYLNGRLFRACSVPHGPVINPGSVPLHILPMNGVFGGKLSGILFRNKLMSADEVNALYHAGPGSSSTGLLDSIFGIKKIDIIMSSGGSSESKYSISL